MTQTMIIDKAQLAAFADGELSPEDAAAVVMHLVDHPEDQAYVDEVMATNLALARAFAAPMQEPIPDRFTAILLPESRQSAATSSSIIAFPKANRTRLVLAGIVSAGLSIAAAVAVVSIFPGSASDLTVGPVADGSTLHEILSKSPSGESVAFGAERALTILSSFSADTGDCREFEMILTKERQIQIGLACQERGGWVLDVVLAEVLSADTVQTNTYAPASGEDAFALDRWLDRRGADAVMTSAQEAERIADGWAQQ